MLGPLVLLVVILLVMVLGGKLLYRDPPASYIQPQRPELSRALSVVEVYDGERLVRRLHPGDPLWAVRLQNGEVAVFAAPDRPAPLGVARAALLGAP